jgi:hypothetical protein
MRDILKDAALHQNRVDVATAINIGLTRRLRSLENRKYLCALIAVFVS